MMMFPTAVKGHIPFAPTYGERMEKQRGDRRRRASDDNSAKRKTTMVSAKQPKVILTNQYSPSKSTTYAKSRKSSRSSDYERRLSDGYLRLSYTSDSQIAVTTLFRKTTDLSAVVSPSDRSRKRITFLRSFINLFRRRTRLSIDVHADGERTEQTAVAAALNGLSITESAAACVCNCACSDAPQLVSVANGSNLSRQTSAARRRSITLRLESILEEEDETEEEDENEDDVEADSAIDVREVDAPSVCEREQCS